MAMTYYHDFSSTGFRCCRKCGAPCTPGRVGRKECPGWKSQRQKKREKQLKKARKNPKQNYRKSRYAQGERVWVPSYSQFGEVWSHVRRKRGTKGEIQWRQTPVVRLDDGLQKVFDDDELRDVEGRERE
jgi:hypothetical protein